MKKAILKKGTSIAIPSVGIALVKQAVITPTNERWYFMHLPKNKKAMVKESELFRIFFR